MMAFSSAKTTLYPTPFRILTHHHPIHLSIYHPIIDSIPSVGRRCFDVLTSTRSVAHIVSRTVPVRAVVCSVESRYEPVSEMCTSSHASSSSLNADGGLPSNSTTHLIETSGPSQPQGSRRRTGYMWSLIPPSTSAIYSSLLRVGNKSV